MATWSIVYEGAYEDDGSLFFPERLNEEKLQELRKSMGLYRFSNQYLNKTVPDDEQDFKKAWWREYTQLPEEYYTFTFTDPAISLNDGADRTATVVVHVDYLQNWYVSVAQARRITATETLNFLFGLYDAYNPMGMGIEDVAYQRSLLHFATEEMIRRNKVLPLKGIKRSSAAPDGGKKSNNSKPFRIRSLVPRFEFGKIFLAQGLDDLRLEYDSFPRGAKDDLLDALSSIEEIVFYPNPPTGEKDVQNPADPRYEKQYIERLTKKRPPLKGRNDFD